MNEFWTGAKIATRDVRRRPVPFTLPREYDLLTIPLLLPISPPTRPSPVTDTSAKLFVIFPVPPPTSPPDEKSPFTLPVAYDVLIRPLLSPTRPPTFGLDGAVTVLWAKLSVTFP